MRTERTLEALSNRVAALEELCGQIYQFAGEVGAPARVLDALWSAAQGQALPARDILPVRADECSEVAALQRQMEEIRSIVGKRPAAAELGRLGGRQTSVAKRRAAVANGRKGGRPRKADRRG
jgi:hypothetical protein